MRLEQGDTVAFSYPAKGQARRSLRVADAEVREVLRRLLRRRSGKELLAYYSGGQWVDVRSPDINEYIKAHAGTEHSAKDFRTLARDGPGGSLARRAGSEGRVSTGAPAHRSASRP